MALEQGWTGREPPGEILDDAWRISLANAPQLLPAQWALRRARRRSP